MRPAPIIAMLLLAHPAAAEDATIYGMGASSCRDAANIKLGWVDRAAFQQWLAGFITGVNNASSAATHNASKDITRSMDISVIEGMVTAYCTKHPNDKYYWAVETVIAQLR
jgi:hypothetical protein